MNNNLYKNLNNNLKNTVLYKYCICDADILDDDYDYYDNFSLSIISESEFKTKYYKIKCVISFSETEHHAIIASTYYELDFKSFCGVWINNVSSRYNKYTKYLSNFLALTIAIRRYINEPKISAVRTANNKLKNSYKKEIH